MSRYHLEEALDPDGANWWNVLEAQENGKLVCIAQCPIEGKADEVINALRWLEAMGSARLSLAMDGITIDANTGKVWEPPKRKRTPTLKIEPSKRKPRA